MNAPSPDPSSPKVSFGMPVYNGARFLAQALDSVLAQEFGDFEVVIADNCSTDETPEIVQTFAAKDPRIKYVRHPRNIGAAKNFNYVFHCTSGPYFAWLAHDDLLRPGFLSQCLQGFETRNNVPAVIYPDFEFLDENLEPVDRAKKSVQTTAASPVRRFAETLDSYGAMTEVYGLFRREAMARTRLIGSFVSSDFVFLAECALVGQIVRLEGPPHFVRRLHEKNSWRANPTTTARLAWFDPDATFSVLKPSRRRSHEYLKAIFSIKGLTLPQRLGAASLLQGRRLQGRSRAEIRKLYRHLRFEKGVT